MPLTDEQEAASKSRYRESGKTIAEACTDRGSDRERENPGVYKADRADASQGKEAIVLIPEIALTYQTVRRFMPDWG